MKNVRDSEAVEAVEAGAEQNVLTKGKYPLTDVRGSCSFPRM